jgi:hypothetical protein
MHRQRPQYVTRPWQHSTRLSITAKSELLATPRQANTLPGTRVIPRVTAPKGPHVAVTNLW